MGIDSPETYGEHYWSMMAEATNFLNEETEDVLSKQARNIISGLKLDRTGNRHFDKLFNELSNPSKPAYAGVLGRFISESADAVVGQAVPHAFKDFNYMMASIFQDQKIDFKTATTLYQRRATTHSMYANRMKYEGYKPAEGAAYYLAQMPYPSIPDIMLYGRYHGNSDSPRGAVWKHFDVPTRDFELWNWLGKQRLTTLQMQELFKRGKIGEGGFYTELAKIGWQRSDRYLLDDLAYTIPNPMLLMQGDLFQRKRKSDIIKNISIGGIHPQYAQTYYDAVLTKPSSQDLVAYELRRSPTLSDLSAKLSKIGIHPEYHDVYKELAFPIPPVADIITMAVREAFSPAIAARFGQYQDYPAEFETYALKKGLSKEWSKRYWAAHWSLPSAQQGFQMLHRGIINESELHLLLRALDIMPFWRDRLTKMAYKRLTRVDIRRMYRVGVLDEGEVYGAYLELGYNDRDAKRMSQFTIKQVLQTQAKFTTGDIVRAYAQQMLNSSEARSLLSGIGVRSENISYILESADYKRNWEMTENRIDAIRNLYKKRVYSDNTARSELLRLNLPAVRVDNLLSSWYIIEKDEPARHWSTAQTLGFIKSELITKTRGIKELKLIGYNDEHINIFMESLA